MMAEAGIDKVRIMDVGRWKTLDVLERYLKGAQYKKVAQVSKWCGVSQLMRFQRHPPRWRMV